MVVNAIDYRTWGWGICPKGTLFVEATQECGCPHGMDWEASVGACKPIRDKNSDRPDLDVCRGNPIYPLTGAKVQSVPLLNFGGRSIGLRYSTRRALSEAGTFVSRGQVLVAPAGAGPQWTFDFERLFYYSNGSQIYLGDDQFDYFKTADGNNVGTLLGQNVTFSYAVGGVWHVREKGKDSLQYFSMAGAGTSNAIAPLRFSQSIFGLQLEFEHNTVSGPNDWRPVPEVASLKDGFGRMLTFEFENPADVLQLRRVKLIKDMSGRVIQFKYNSDGMLSDIVWPDGTSRQFRYEVKDQPWLLTSWIDESGAVVGRYSYDPRGRAVSTQVGAGTNSFRVKRWATEPAPIVKRWYDPVEGVIWREVVWTDPQEVEVEGPNGLSNVISTVMVNQMPRLASQSQPAGSGCAAAVREQRYDANGNVSSRTDFTGRRSCMTYDLNRNLESSRIEGLDASAACETLLRSETLPKGARRVSTAWHPVWNLPIRTAEPGRIVTKVYNGQPDPFDANRIASCAGYYGAYLLDNSPMVLLCKQVEQATTDLDGSKGFSATPQAGASATRIWQYTYDPYGRVQTAKDPLGNVTSNEYYLGSNADVTVGDLKSTTNALGHMVTYTKYTPSGLLLKSVDQNGLPTSYSYDLRDRVTSITVGDRTTNLSYWPTGLLRQAMLADGSLLNYEYDDAHRLVGVVDGLGNRIDYVLDGAGNKTSETVKDAGGRLARQVGRLMDALGRVQQVSGRE